MEKQSFDKEKIEKFAALIELDQLETCYNHFRSRGVLTREELKIQMALGTVEFNYKVIIKYGRKYARFDIRKSGRFMIDTNGNIFGTRSYRQVNTKRPYGTLDTIHEWYWGDYFPKRKEK